MKTMSVIIVAGGIGQRMGMDIPKQFLITRGRPVLMWSIEAFDEANEIIVVLPAEHRKRWLELCEEYDFKVAHILIDGGNERYKSVQRGLMAVSENAEYIGVHDGVRPWIQRDVIKCILTKAKERGAAIPVVKVTDTIRLMNESGQSSILNRQMLRAVQTPQIFKRDILIHSYMILDSDANVTDDASVIELAGYEVALVDGDVRNIKITYPEDL